MSLLTKCQIFHKIPPQVGFKRKKQQTHNENVDFSAHRSPMYSAQHGSAKV